jgi:hypothetical protein
MRCELTDHERAAIKPMRHSEYGRLGFAQCGDLQEQ